MAFDDVYDGEVYERLMEIAEAHESYWTYQCDARYDSLVEEFVAHYPDTDRATVYERLKRLGAYAYDDVHDGTIWKAFVVRRKGGWAYTGTAYTLSGESLGEDVRTMAQLAHDLGVTPDEVWYQFEDAASIGRLRREA